MQDQTTTTLTTVLSEVLANLAFMFNDDCEFDPPVGEQWLETLISYEGSVSGSLRLTCTETFATQLAANLLATESGVATTRQESHDAVKEFMNVICGQYITAAYGSEDVFNLSIPEVLERSSTPILGDPQEAAEDMALLSVDGQWMQLLHTRSE